MDTSIHKILMDGVLTRLTTETLDEVVDDSKAGRVKTGVFQSDPTKTKITIIISHGDEKWPDMANTENVGLMAPFAEFGQMPGYFWRRRYEVEVRMFPTTKDQTAAMELAEVVMSRVEWALQYMTIPTTVDSFGEHASAIGVCKTTLIEGGGNSQRIWTGTIFYEFITEKEAESA